MSEPFYGGEWASEMENWYPADDDEDDGWPYPDNDNPGDIPSVQTFHYVDDELYDRITEDDDPVETGDPDDMRGWD